LAAAALQIQPDQILLSIHLPLRLVAVLAQTAALLGMVVQAAVLLMVLLAVLPLLDKEMQAVKVLQIFLHITQAAAAAERVLLVATLVLIVVRVVPAVRD
jgi:hypothetical protein